MTPKEAHAKLVEAYEKAQAIRKAFADPEAPTPDEMLKFDKAVEAVDQAKKLQEFAQKAADIDALDPIGSGSAGDVKPLSVGRKPSLKTRDERRYHSDRALYAYLFNARGWDYDPAYNESAELLGVKFGSEHWNLGHARQVRENGGQPYCRFDHGGRMVQFDLTTMPASPGQAYDEGIPEDFVDRVYQRMLQNSSLRPYCTVIASGPGVGDLPIPLEDDTGNTSGLLAETTEPSYDDPTITERTLQGSQFTTAIRFSRPWLEDNPHYTIQRLADRLGLRHARGQNSMFTTGDGSTGVGLAEEPWGVVARAAAGTTVDITGDTVSYAETLNMIHALDPAYRSMGSFWLSFHDSMLKRLRSIVDASSGQPIWQESMRAGEPGRIFGKPYFINQDMDDAAVIAIGENPILAGAMEYFIIRDKTGIQLGVARERFMETNQIAIFLRQLSDSDIATEDSWAASAPIRVQERAS